jgi:predicted Rossmann-fold nucleotide-binding protein
VSRAPADETSLPFNPLRQSLYSATELFAGYDPADPDSYAACPDARILAYFAKYGHNPVGSTGASTLEALHDNSVSLAMQPLLRASARVVAIMGGHNMVRGTPAFAATAHLAHDLGRAGILLASGGGPGAMEATHLGALFAPSSRGELDRALATLAAEPDLPPRAKDLVNRLGEIDPAVARALHRWFAPAHRLAMEFAGGGGGASLGVPTWLYGHEPTTPLATHIAKYFQNSVREDGLVTIAVSGIVYAQGSAGTVQEIFQDASQNYYGDAFYPMVFLSGPGTDYWSSTLPVRPLIEALLARKPDYGRRVLFTDDAAAALAFLTGAGA